MVRPAVNRRTLLLAAVLISSIALALLLWRILPISCPSQPEWWMVGC
jgi:hypothetical protein